MEILLNNRSETIDGYDQLTVKELLDVKKFTYKMLIVRINNVTIKSEHYDSTVIKEGDTVHVIHLMAGG